MATDNGRRTFNKVLALFLFRTALFSCAQVVFYFIRQPHHQQQQTNNNSGDNEVGWSMPDIVALSSCCWLVLTIDLGIVEILRFLWKKRQSGRGKKVADQVNCAISDGEQKGDLRKNKRRETVCSILLIPQTDWYTLKSSVLLNENIEVKVNSNSINGNNKHCESSKNERTKKNATGMIVTPWTLWYYVYAAGIGLFILGFSVNGLSLISETSVLLSSIIAISFFFHEDIETSFPLQYIASWGMGIGVCLIVVAYVVDAPYVWGWMFLENMWMAVVLPTVTSIFLCKCSLQARAMNLTPERILMFAMPSLAVMSAAFLCFYFPASKQRSFYIQLQNLFEDGIDFYDRNANSSIILKLSESLGYTQHYGGNDNNNNGSSYYEQQQQQSPIYFSLVSWANSTQMEGVKNFVNAGRGLDMLIERGNALSIISILLAPFMLWAAMVTVIGSAIRGACNVQSAFSSYILVLTVKHFLLNGGGPWNIASLVIVVPSCIMTMVAETWKNSSFYTHYHFDSGGDDRRGDLDDNDAEDESETDDAVDVASV